MAENSTLCTLIPSIGVKWNINNFCNLWRKVNYSIKSSCFPFAATNCNLEIFPNGQSYYKSFKWIGVYLNIEPSLEDYHIIYSISINSTDGSEIASYTDKDVFVMGKEITWLGTDRLIKRSILLRTEDAIAPDGSLEVVCVIRKLDGFYASDLDQLSTAPKPGVSLKVASVETASQTPSPGVTLETASQTLSPVVTVEAASQTSSPFTTMESEPYISSTTEQHAEIASESDGISTLVEDFKNIYISRNYSDVTILVQNKMFHAHRNILGGRSAVFASMFEHEFAEKIDGEVKISDCDPDTFEKFLLFLYIGKIDDLTISKAVHLYITADMYDVKQLKEECVQCMVRDMSIEYVCDVIRLAMMHNDSDLLKAATDFFINNVEDILPTTKWQQFLGENLVVCNELLIKVMKSKK